MPTGQYIQNIFCAPTLQQAVAAEFGSITERGLGNASRLFNPAQKTIDPDLQPSINSLQSDYEHGKMEPWRQQVTQLAYQKILNTDGQIKPEIYIALNQKGQLDQLIEEKGHDMVAFDLVAGYITNAVGNITGLSSQTDFKWMQQNPMDFDDPNDALMPQVTQLSQSLNVENSMDKPQKLRDINPTAQPKNPHDYLKRLHQFAEECAKSADRKPERYVYTMAQLDQAIIRESKRHGAERETLRQQYQVTQNDHTRSLRQAFEQPNLDQNSKYVTALKQLSADNNSPKTTQASAQQTAENIMTFNGRISSNKWQQDSSRSSLLKGGESDLTQRIGVTIKQYEALKKDNPKDYQAHIDTLYEIRDLGETLVSQKNQADKISHDSRYHAAMNLLDDINTELKDKLHSHQQSPKYTQKQHAQQAQVLREKTEHFETVYTTPRSGNETDELKAKTDLANIQVVLTSIEQYEQSAAYQNDPGRKFYETTKAEYSGLQESITEKLTSEEADMSDAESDAETVTEKRGASPAAGEPAAKQRSQQGRGELHGSGGTLSGHQRAEKHNTQTSAAADPADQTSSTPSSRN